MSGDVDKTGGINRINRVVVEHIAARNSKMVKIYYEFMHKGNEEKLERKIHKFKILSHEIGYPVNPVKAILKKEPGKIRFTKNDVLNGKALELTVKKNFENYYTMYRKEYYSTEDISIMLDAYLTKPVKIWLAKYSDFDGMPFYFTLQNISDGLWYGSHYIVTQDCMNPIEKHLAVVAILDVADQVRLLGNVGDEGRYIVRRDLEYLRGLMNYRYKLAGISREISPQYIETMEKQLGL